MTEHSIEDLRQGESIARGEFLLDQNQARKKLQQFQLVNPHYYVLEFVKAAHILSATRISFHITTNKVDLLFDGEPLIQEELDILYSAAFRQRQDLRQRALRHLAIGVNAAHGIGMQKLSIEVGGPLPCGVRFFEDRIEPLEKFSPGLTQTQIVLSHRKTPAHLLRVFGGFVSQFPESSVLRTRARFSDIPIYSNKSCVSCGHHLPGQTFKPITFDINGERGVVALEGRRPYNSGRIQHSDPLFTTHLLQHGVLVSTDTRPTPFPGFGFQAIVDSPLLTPNLSQSAFVADAAWRDLQKRLNRGAVLSMAEVLSEYSSMRIAQNRVPLQRLILATFDEIDPSNIPPKYLDRVLEVFADLSIFNIAISQKNTATPTISIAEARTTTEEGRSLIRFATTSQRIESEPPFDAPILFIDSFDIASATTSLTSLTALPGEFLHYFADDIENVTHLFDEERNHHSQIEELPHTEYDEDDLPAHIYLFDERSEPEVQQTSTTLARSTTSEHQAAVERFFSMHDVESYPPEPKSEPKEETNAPEPLRVEDLLVERIGDTLHEYCISHTEVNFIETLRQDGDHLLDRTHPAIENAYRSPQDSTAIAFAALAVFASIAGPLESKMLRSYGEAQARMNTRRSKRQLLSSLTSELERGKQT